MHPTTLARRQSDAQNQIMDAAGLLAEHFGIDAPAYPHVRDPEIAQMMRFEEIAKFLQELALVPVGIDRDELLNEVLTIEGLTKTSAEKIREHFSIEAQTDGTTN